jgi:hypothetical protein
MIFKYRTIALTAMLAGATLTATNPQDGANTVASGRRGSCERPISPGTASLTHTTQRSGQNLP